MRNCNFSLSVIFGKLRRENVVVEVDMARVLCSRCKLTAESVRTGLHTAKVTYDLATFLNFCLEAKERLALGQSIGEGWFCSTLQMAHEQVIDRGRL
jgi:hypothetical protein